MAKLWRHPDWAARLLAYLAAIEGEPFRYGQSDCFSFVDGAVNAMTGGHLFPALPAYRTRAAALTALTRLGHVDLMDAAKARAAELGWATIPETDAEPGDIAVLPGAPQTSLALCWIDGVIGKTVEGLALFPHGHALLTWKIPYAD